MEFRTLRVSTAGWAMIGGAGAVLGFGLHRQSGWALWFSVPAGIVAVWAAIWLLDRRAFRRALTVVRVDRSVAELDKLASRLAQRGLRVAVSQDPRGIACRGKAHRKVVAAIEADGTGAPSRRR